MRLGQNFFQPLIAWVRFCFNNGLFMVHCPSTLVRLRMILFHSWVFLKQVFFQLQVLWGLVSFNLGELRVEFRSALGCLGQVFFQQWGVEG